MINNYNIVYSKIIYIFYAFVGSKEVSNSQKEKKRKKGKQHY